MRTMSDNPTPPTRCACAQAHGAEVPTLWTALEVSKYLRCSERSIWAATFPRGALRAVRIGRLVRYDPADVARFIAESKERDK